MAEGTRYEYNYKYEWSYKTEGGGPAQPPPSQPSPQPAATTEYKQTADAQAVHTVEVSDARSSRKGWKMDTRYPRSIEGILRIITAAVAILGLIFVMAAVFASVGGWFFFVGFSYLVYVVIVFVIEMCIPGVYVYRLIDAIIVFAYAALFAFAAILNTAFGVRDGSVLLGLGAACGYICAILCVAQGVFALKTWRSYESGRKGSQPVILI